MVEGLEVGLVRTRRGRRQKKASWRGLGEIGSDRRHDQHGKEWRAQEEVK